jgi:Ala-tRNA(Pro) deacylase
MTDLIAFLRALGVETETHAHPPVLTVDEARAHWAAIDAAHTKNLLLKDAGGVFWLVVMPAEATLDLKSLPARIGSKRLRFAPPEELPRLLGVETGAVSALAVINDVDNHVRLVVDARLMEAPRIAFHPLDNRRTTVITPDGLSRFLDALGREAIVAQL